MLYREDRFSNFSVIIVCVFTIQPLDDHGPPITNLSKQQPQCEPAHSNCWPNSVGPTESASDKPLPWASSCPRLPYLAPL